MNLQELFLDDLSDRHKMQCLTLRPSTFVMEALYHRARLKPQRSIFIFIFYHWYVPVQRWSGLVPSLDERVPDQISPFNVSTVLGRETVGNGESPLIWPRRRQKPQKGGWFLPAKLSSQALLPNDEKNCILSEPPRGFFASETSADRPFLSQVLSLPLTENPLSTQKRTRCNFKEFYCFHRLILAN